MQKAFWIMSAEIKDHAAFFKYLASMELETPPVVIISGSDTGILDSAMDQIKNRLHKEIGPFETTVFSGEPGDSERFHRELFNIPLFAPYRFIVVRHGDELFSALGALSKNNAGLKADFARIPDRTLLLIEHPGTATKSLLSLFPDRCAHFATRELYANQVPDVIRAMAKKAGIHLDEDAVSEIRDRVEPKTAAIESAIARLADLHPDDKKHAITTINVRDVLFPSPGCNSFALVDALYARDHDTVERELIRFNPQTDNFFGIFKLILNRANEIRLASTGKAMSMSDEELIDLLELKSRPPFVQKKILVRLADEMKKFGPGRLTKIYDFLISIQKDYRTNVGLPQQNLYFQERILEVFFK